MAHAQKPDFIFQRNGRIHLNRQGGQFSRLLAAEVCASAVVKLDTPCSKVVWGVLATHSTRQFPLHFPPPVRHRVPSRFNWTLPIYQITERHIPEDSNVHNRINICTIRIIWTEMETGPPWWEDRIRYQGSHKKYPLTTDAFRRSTL
jgi:hypothetical protein